MSLEQDMYLSSVDTNLGNEAQRRNKAQTVLPV